MRLHVVVESELFHGMVVLPNYVNLHVQPKLPPPPLQMKSAILITFASIIGVALSAKTLTEVQFEGKGFKDLNFAAHLHNAPCSNNDGGGVSQMQIITTHNSFTNKL